MVQGDPQATRAIRRGLVLPGGAALGAFQAGALKAIREAGIEFHIIAATSIGLVHALAWNRGEEFVARLDGRWRKDAAEFAPFDPKRLLRLKNPFSFGKSLDKLFSQYRSTQPNVGDKGTIPILISLTEAATGRNVAFSVSEPGLSAAVPYYGTAPKAEDVAKIRAPINAQYGETDTRITAGWAAYDAALTAAGVAHEGHIYKGAGHGFFNDTTPRYSADASKEAWGHTLDWFGKYVKA